VVLGGINVTGLNQDAPFTEAEMADARSIQNAFTVTHSSKGVTVEIDKEGIIRAKQFTDLDGNPVGGDDLSSYVSTDPDVYNERYVFNGDRQGFTWLSNKPDGRKYEIVIGQNNFSPSIGLESAFFIGGTTPDTNKNWEYSINEYGVVELSGMRLYGKNGATIENFDSVQATDFLDADGNSIVGAGGGGDPEWAKVDIEKSSTALGWYAEAGQNSTAVGFNAVAGSSNCVALGRGIYNLQYSSIGIGSNVDGVGGQSIAIGSAVDNIADNCVVIGSGVARVADNSIAIGSNITAESDKSIAIGSNITTNSECPDAISIGHGVSINDRSRYAIAIGTEAEVEDESDYSIALGYQANAEESEFAISPYIQNVDFARANIKAKDYLDIDGKRATVSPALIAEAFTTLQAAVADEDTVEGIKTALTNALGGLIEKFEGIHNA
jgi:hypothetical protein